MKHLGKSKLTKLQAKPGISYTLIRLPHSELVHVGETGHIFKTEHNGKPVYVISLDEEFNGEIKVVQPETISDLEARLETLEKEVYKDSDSENKENKDKNSGPAEIRTQDLRRVKAGECATHAP